MLFVLILSFSIVVYAKDNYTNLLSCSTEILYAVPVEEPETEVPQTQVAIFGDDYTTYKSDNNFDKATDKIELGVENYISGGTATEDAEAYKLVKGDTVQYSVNIPQNGAYNIALMFAVLDEITEDYKFSLKIDGVAPFPQCEELIVKSLWEDEGEIRTLTNGDQVNPLQKHKEGFYLQKITDSEGIELMPYEFMLSEGDHVIEVTALGKEFLLQKIQ